MCLPWHEVAFPGMARRFPLGLALVVTIAAAAAGVAEEPPFIHDLFAKHNQARAQHGLKPLRYNALLAKAAQSQAEWMARGRKPVTGKPEEHLREKPTTPQEFRTCNWYPVNRVINTGYFTWDEMFVEQNGPNGVVVSPRPGTDAWVQENIACAVNAGHPARQTPELIAGWMKSAGHRANILTPHFEEMGIGTAVIDDTTYWCVVFAKPGP